jgi:hypothetical protein
MFVSGELRGVRFPIVPRGRDATRRHRYLRDAPPATAAKSMFSES